MDGSGWTILLARSLSRLSRVTVLEHTCRNAWNNVIATRTWTDNREGEPENAK